MNACKFPFFAKHIREREQAALPVESGVEASLDHYGLCRARLSFGQDTIAAVSHLLEERQGGTMGSFRVRARGMGGELYLTIIIFRLTVAHRALGARWT